MIKKGVILVFNVGSSTIKCSVYDKKTAKIVEKQKYETLFGLPSFHRAALALMVRFLGKYNVLAIGHRVVHGKDLKKPLVVDGTLLKKLEEISNLAPLHNMPETHVIKSCAKFGIPQVAVFDSAFHTTINQTAKIYGLPKKLTDEGYVRYGFHGISHEYVSQKAAAIYRKKFGKAAKKIISCHLGSGSSITAVLNGKSYDTSMGYTPMEGPIMATRSGTVDPGIILDLCRKMGAEAVNSMLNHDSGIKGISGYAFAEKAFYSKDRNSRLAFDKFCYDVAKIVGSYIAAMNGCDLILFTAGIGENNSDVRKAIINYFGFAGAEIDDKFNKAGKEGLISKSNAKVKVMVIKTDEEKSIMETVKEIVRP